MGFGCHCLIYESLMGLGCPASHHVVGVFQAATNSNTGEIIVSGMGELHLEVYIERIRREYKVGIWKMIVAITS